MYIIGTHIAQGGSVNTEESQGGLGRNPERGWAGTDAGLQDSQQTERGEGHRCLFPRPLHGFLVFERSPFLEKKTIPTPWHNLRSTMKGLGQIWNGHAIERETGGHCPAGRKTQSKSSEYVEPLKSGLSVG